MKNRIQQYWQKETGIAPLAVFRILFGGVMLASIIRFVANGWVETQYILPKYFFTYYGFDWVKPLGPTGMYMLFAIMGLSALMIMLGSFYRIAIITFFLTFTYTELIDKTNYLNHYYFISIVSFLMIFLPAHRHFSIDTWRKPELRLDEVPRWTIDAVKLQLGIVYFFAGLAKLNYDWLVLAMPLKYWLPAQSHIPYIGDIFTLWWMPHAMSWIGALYDLTIPFFLLSSRTRSYAYVAVIGFHLMTGLLFQIGMFPYVMILSTLIFFNNTFHKRIIHHLRMILNKLFLLPERAAVTSKPLFISNGVQQAVQVIFVLFFTIQVLLPFRYTLYPGNLFWNEEGYRFSWRVMLMEKAGTAFFYVKDPVTGAESEVTNSDFLTVTQEKMMATQPDMILQYAKIIGHEYERWGIVKDPIVRAEVYVTLNGRGSQFLIDPNVNLMKQEENFKHKEWVLPIDTDK